MALFDIFILVLVVLSGIKGYQRGFVIEIFSLLAFFIGLFLALKLTFPIATRFFGDLDAFWIIALVIFLVLFFLTVWLARYFAVSIKKVIDFTPIGILDNLLGVLISVLKWLFIISTTIWVLNSIELYLPIRWIEDSDFYGIVTSLAPIIVETVSAVIPWFRDIMETMEIRSDWI